MDDARFARKQALERERDYALVELSECRYQLRRERENRYHGHRVEVDVLCTSIEHEAELLADIQRWQALVNDLAHQINVLWREWDEVKAAQRAAREERKRR